MANIEFHIRTPSSFLLLDHITYISSNRWSWCQYSRYIFIFMASILESNIWTTSSTYGIFLHINSMKTLVHRGCHWLPKPHIGAIYPYRDASLSFLHGIHVNIKYEPRSALRLSCESAQRADPPMIRTRCTNIWWSCLIKIKLMRSTTI